MKRYVASMVVVSFAALTVGIGGALAQAREQPACDRFAFDREPIQQFSFGSSQAPKLLIEQIGDIAKGNLLFF